MSVGTNQLQSQAGPTLFAQNRPEPHSGGMSVKAYQEIKSNIHRNMLAKVDLEKLSSLQDMRARQQILGVIQDLASSLDTPLSMLEKDRLCREVLDEVFGLGPLEPLLQDPTINDILVNTHRSVYVERAGILEKTNVVFKDELHLMHIIDKIVSAVGRRVDESSPMVDARLSDGSRVNVIIPPLAVDGAILSVRRFGHVPLEAEDLLSNKAMTLQMLELLKGAIKARLNIVISGGTGAGKTTLLNVLSTFIPEEERIVTIEDSAELQLKQAHVVRLECRPANVEGRGGVRQRELLVNSLRMRPDRIIVGEVRSEEALDMLQAMNTGHDGSLTTVHANSPRDAIARMETMALMANLNLPEKAIRQQIASAIAVIIQISRMSDGSRRITHFTEVTGMTEDIVSLQDIYVFEKRGIGDNRKVLGRFRSTGVVPKFIEKLKASGIDLPLNLFDVCMDV
ncbi:CpaF family protein [Edaphobacter bradus]|uniref:CpaF family protein n=1 Tax=Edaphobacter bradus TaxID=2259016 RepID=UPI0021DFBAE4|nr:CpaF family protein [Edaphobacter bradus]